MFMSNQNHINVFNLILKRRITSRICQNTQSLLFNQQATVSELCDFHKSPKKDFFIIVPISKHDARPHPEGLPFGQMSRPQGLKIPECAQKLPVFDDLLILEHVRNKIPEHCRELCSRSCRE